MKLKVSEPSDSPFLREMLFEAVYWRAIENGSEPEFETGLADPEISKVAANWGKQEGDLGVIAIIDSLPVGAAWIRYWSDENSMRGYVNSSIPVLVIGVQSNYRQRGVGKALIKELLDLARVRSIEAISLMVSKDNPAIHLYKKCGFAEFEEVGDSWLMIAKISVRASVI